MVSNDHYCSQPTAVLVGKYTLTSLMRTGELTTCVLSQLAPKHQFRVGASISMYAGYTLIFRYFCLNNHSSWSHRCPTNFIYRNLGSL